MYKILVFMENQIPLIEETLNGMSGWDIETTWSTSTRLVIIMKKNKVGRPSKQIETHEE